MYSLYVFEREGLRELRKDYGFIHYKITGEGENKECFLSDLYIIDECRRSGKSHKITNELVELARQEKCKWLTTMVDLSTNNVESSLGTILKYGFKLADADGRIMSFAKEI